MLHEDLEFLCTHTRKINLNEPNLLLCYAAQRFQQCSNYMPYSWNILLTQIISSGIVTQ